MWRKLSLVFLACSMVISCSKKSQVKPDDSATDGVDDSQVMTFDMQGSDSGNISGLTTVRFDFDQATLSSTAKELLKQNADWIRNHSGVKVQIEGHCDERGSIEYNLALGQRRAKAVKNYLVNLGVDPQRLTTISFGKEKPVAMGDSESAYAQNRRANFLPLAQ